MRSSKRLGQQLIAMIVIVAMLDFVGFSPILIAFFFLAGFLVWRVILRTNRQQAQEVFDFYIAADEILRDQQRHWYGFEIAEVLNCGERVLGWMPDPPPLLYFALGALHHRAGDYESAIENLAEVVENGLIEEHHRSAPSPALRHYVQMLRNIEREPAIAPQALAALRSLERCRRSHGASLLSESRERFHEIAVNTGAGEGHDLTDLSVNPVSPLATSVTAPRPISEVLHDVYQEEKTA